MSELALKALCKSYGKVEAVKSLDLTIHDGEFMVLVGPSGCGKTTTLRMIAGLETITDGEIYLDGKLINNVPPRDRDMAMVFQDYALYPHMSVYDNIGFSLKMRKVKKAEIKSRVNEAAALLGIERLLERKPHALSGGERQRVALGRAIVRNPKVFLFDEPLSNLDTALRSQMRGELLQLHKKLGTTFIYVTHDQIEAMTMATRITVMNLGVIQQCDTPGNVYDHPANSFVGGFIGSPKMNLIRCVPYVENGRVCLYIGEDKLIPPEELGNSLLGRYVVGKYLYLGMRPQHGSLCPPDAQCIRASVKYAENTGGEIYLHLSAANEQEIVIIIQAREPIEQGCATGVAPDWEYVRFFDAETGMGIRMKRGG